MEPVDLMAKVNEHETEIDTVYRQLAALDVEPKARSAATNDVNWRHS